MLEIIEILAFDWLWSTFNESEGPFDDLKLTDFLMMPEFYALRICHRPSVLATFPFAKAWSLQRSPEFWEVYFCEPVVAFTMVVIVTLSFQKRDQRGFLIEILGFYPIFAHFEISKIIRGDFEEIFSFE